MTVLDEPTWQRREADVLARLRPYVEAHRLRRARGEKEVVSDFLFDYYGLRSRHLLDWTPGVGTIVIGPRAVRFRGRPHFDMVDHGGMTGYAPTGCALSEKRRRSVTWIRKMLTATQMRPPFLGCFGLHEWAMLYRGGDVRHSRLPLRMTRAQIDEVVRSHVVSCTHFDAFRFFSDAARPLNRTNLARSNALQHEQPGCLHANMDTLRWAVKLYPFVASDVLADAFELAYRIREVDMRASPYDLSDAGLEPICIETDEGKAEYRTYQKQFVGESEPIRRRLIDATELLEDQFEAQQLAEHDV